MKLNRALAPVAALLLTLSAPQIVHADATADARKAITAAYARLNAAAMKKDAEAILAMHTADYVETDKKGQKHTIAELKQMIPQVFRMAKSIQAKTTVQKVTMKGKDAVAVSKDHSEIIVGNPQNPAQTAKVVVDSTSEDTWTKTASGWKQKSSRSLSSTQTINGKPAPGR